MNIVILLVLDGQLHAHQDLDAAIAASLLGFWQGGQNVVISNGNTM